VKSNLKKGSLQKIQDTYENLGYKGDKLREILNKDKEFKKIVKERKKELTQQFKIAPTEKKKYVLSTNEDYEILSKIKQLEKLKLTKEDKYLIKFVKTQLEHDWRKPILKTLSKVLKKYERK